ARPGRERSGVFGSPALRARVLGGLRELAPGRGPPAFPTRGRRGAADRAVATAGLELRTERLPDPRVKLAPTCHLSAQLDDPPIEGVDGRLLLGDLLLEGPRLERQLPELNPVAQQREERRDGDRDAGNGGQGCGSGDVEPDDAGAVATHDQQAELLAAGPPPVSPGTGQLRLNGPCFRARYGVRQSVNGRFQGTHGRRSRARRVPRRRLKQSGTS